MVPSPAGPALAVKVRVECSKGHAYVYNSSPAYLKSFHYQNDDDPTFTVQVECPECGEMVVVLQKTDERVR